VPERLAGERVPADVLGQRRALAPVARRLRALTPCFRIASRSRRSTTLVCPLRDGRRRRRTGPDRESSIPSAKRAGSSRWRRSASTRTRSCGWRPAGRGVRRRPPAARHSDEGSDAGGERRRARRDQVGVLRRVFVFAPDDERVLALVNPSTTRGEEQEMDDEGCLSIQGVTVPVERSTPCGWKGATSRAGGRLRPRGHARADRAARVRPPRRQADARPHDAGSAARGDGGAAAALVLRSGRAAIPARPASRAQSPPSPCKAASLAAASAASAWC
jgi:hypothetical protein